MESFLEIFDSLKLKDLVVVVNYIILQIIRCHVNNRQIWVFDFENPGNLSTLNLLELLCREPLELPCCNRVHMYLNSWLIFDFAPVPY